MFAPNGGYCLFIIMFDNVQCIICFQSEDIRFDPVMLTSCIKDITTFCSDVTEGQAKVSFVHV